MRAYSILVAFLCVLLGAAAGVALSAAALLNGWLPFSPAAAKPEAGHGHGSPDFAQISPQAQANLGLVVKPVKLELFERKVTVPAHVVDRPGHCEVFVTAPVAGVVTQIHAVPGEAVAPGSPLVALRLLGEELLGSQKELFKTTKDLQISQDERKRAENGGSAARLVEIDYQIRRLNAALDAVRQDLAARGLSQVQIQAAAEGRFLTDMTAVAPDRPPHQPGPQDSAAQVEDFRFDVASLKVNAGEKVQAGQALCVLNNHVLLDLEGHGFRQEATLIQRAAVEGWAVEAEFP